MTFVIKKISKDLTRILGVKAAPVKVRTKPQKIQKTINEAVLTTTTPDNVETNSIASVLNLIFPSFKEHFDTVGIRSIKAGCNGLQVRLKNNEIYDIDQLKDTLLNDSKVIARRNFIYTRTVGKEKTIFQDIQFGVSGKSR